jgi:hypothetical protein
MAFGYAPPPQVNNLLGMLASTPRYRPNGLIPTEPSYLSSIANALMTPQPREEVRRPSKPAFRETWAKANFGQELQRPFWTIDRSVPVLLGLNPMFAGLRWPRLFGQIFRLDKWIVCRG